MWRTPHFLIQLFLPLGAITAATLLADRPGVCLLLGFFSAALLNSLFHSNPFPQRILPFSKLCMAWAIVGLGATVQIHAVFNTSLSTLSLTLITITTTIVLGWYGGKLLGVSKDLSILIAAGTAICGASAIAAVGAAIKAKPGDITVALAVILMFNTLALFLFPWLGHFMGLTSLEFAVWSGIAIHDTSSVVGAAMAFDPRILVEATTIKLARAVWIAPLTMFYCFITANQGQKMFAVPWFIWGFLGASLLFSWLTLDAATLTLIRTGTRGLFAAALFLMGTTIQLDLLRKTGPRPLLLGAILWVTAAVLVLILL